MNSRFLLLFLFVGMNFLQAQTVTKADVNVNTRKSTEGVSEFDREVYINLHSSYTASAWKTNELEYLVEDLGVSFGRSVGGVTWQMNRINEDPNRPGFFDLDHMRTLGAQTRNGYANNSSIHRFESTSSVLTSHTSPLFPNGTQTNQGWAPDGFESVGQFYAYLVKEYYGGDGQPRPRFIEVINEPFVHSNDLNTTNALLSEFHAVVADSIKAHNSDVLVGGYTAAWPEFERNNFDIWNTTWKTFIDIAGEKMDFFSFHLYDKPDEGNHTFRKGSNTEAIFDMIEQYSMLKLGEVRPMVLSEYGACCADWDDPYYPERDWLILKSVTSLTMSMMDRPHKVLKAIPFIVDKATWFLDNNPYPYPFVVLENLNGGSEWEYTHLVKYYQLWSNVEGTRVDTWANDPDLQMDAYVKENKAFIILNNLELADQEVDLNVFELEDNPVQEVYIKHLYAIEDIPQLDESTLGALPNTLVIGKEGTAVVEVRFQNPVEINRNEEVSKHYTNKYLQAINANSAQTFQINNISVGDFGEAILRVGLGRAHGKSLNPTVRFNGTPIDFPTDWKGYSQFNREDFFGAIEITVPFELVQADNEVSITFPDAGGHISTVTMEIRNFDYDPDRTLVSTQRVEPAWATDFQLFPNPTNKVVQLTGVPAQTKLDIQIFNMNGSQVYQGRMENGSTLIQVDHLSKGIYQMVLRANDGIINRKLVIQ